MQTNLIAIIALASKSIEVLLLTLLYVVICLFFLVVLKTLLQLLMLAESLSALDSDVTG